MNLNSAKLVFIARVLTFLGVAGVAACSGSSSPPTSGTREPLPVLSQDIDPVGDPVDLAGQQYVVMAPGDQWTYEVRIGLSAERKSLNRHIEAGANSVIVLIDELDGVSTRESYRRTEKGLVAVNPFAGAFPDTAASLIGDLLQFPEPNIPVGSVRRQIRQGSWGEDLDGDGTDESFRLEVDHKLVRFETIRLPLGTYPNSAYFQSSIQLTIFPSDERFVLQTGRRETEDTWWAPDIGIIRAGYQFPEIGNLNELHNLTFARVDGSTAYPQPVDGTVIKVPVEHNAAVFDANRNLFYASVPGDAVNDANSIAIINPTNGAVSFVSMPSGSDPGQLAMSADGNALYLGLDGTGEVARISLPEFEFEWRTTLPDLPFFGQLFAGSLAVSPPESDTVAVATEFAGTSLGQHSVMLIRDGILNARIEEAQGASDAIVFDPNGLFVYGFNLDSPVHELSRFAIYNDGIQWDLQAPRSGNASPFTFYWTSRGVLRENAFYRSPDLSGNGSLPSTVRRCTEHRATGRYVCVSRDPFTTRAADGPRTLSVFDPITLALQSEPVYERGAEVLPFNEIIPGQAGTVALRLGAETRLPTSKHFWIFTSDLLR